MVFGVSVGDFIAVGKLTHDVMQALSETKGAEVEYKTLIELLRSLSSTIATVNSFLTSSAVSSRMQISDALRNGFRLHITACYSLMSKFLRDSRKYTESLFNGKGHAVVKEFRKVKWCLYRSEDTSTLERHLLMHFTALQQYLALINIQHQAQLDSMAERNLLDIRNALKEGFQFVQAAQQTRQHSLGVPWEDGNGAQPILLEDFFTHKHPMPQLLCRNFRTFYDAISLMFRATFASEILSKHDFEVVDLANGRRIWPPHRIEAFQVDDFSIMDCPSWQTNVRSGTRLALNWVRKIKKETEGTELMPVLPKNRRCPRCKTPHCGDRFVICTVCNISFGHSLEECSRGRKSDWDAWPAMTYNLVKLESPFERVKQIVAIPEVLIPPYKQSSEQYDGSSLVQGSTNRESSTRYETMFRRIHVIEEFYRPPSHAYNQFEMSRVPIIQAAGQGDAAWVRQLLSATTMIANVRDHQGWTPLQQACGQGRGECEEVVRLLLEAGAEVNARPGIGFARTALQAACECPNPSVPVVNLLLDFGAHIQAPSLPGEPTAVQAAAMAGNLDILKVLIQRGAFQNGPPPESAFSATAALQAASAGPRERTDPNIERYIRIITLLLAHGADVNAPPAANARYRALQRAAWQNQVEIAKTLIEAGADVNGEQHPSTGKTAIQAGAKCGPMIDLLMAHSANINAAPSSAGRTTLQHAAAIPGGNLALIRKIIEYGADVNQEPAPFWGRSALQEASHYGSYEVVVALVEEYNADVNGPTAIASGPLTALEACAFRGSISNSGHTSLCVMKFLLEKGAKVTPNVLHFAAAKGEEDTVRMLLSYGAQIYVPPTPFEHEPIPRGNDRPLGKDVFDTARINNQEGVIMVLRHWLHEPERPTIGLSE